MLSQFCDEFRIRRGAVLRWIRGWYAERGVDELPAAVRRLPPIAGWNTRGGRRRSAGSKSTGPRSAGDNDGGVRQAPEHPWPPPSRHRRL